MQRVGDCRLYDTDTAECIWEGTDDGGMHTAIYRTPNGRWFSTGHYTAANGNEYVDFNVLTEVQAGDTLAYHAGVAFARRYFAIGDA